MHEDAERVLAQGIWGAGGLNGNRQDGSPAAGFSKAAIAVSPFGPGDAKT